MQECYELAGVLSISVRGETLRTLRWRLKAHERAWRERWVSLGLLLLGKVADVQAFLDHGICDPPKAAPMPEDVDAQVRRAIEAIRLNNGQFLMPDDAERLLAIHGKK